LSGDLDLPGDWKGGFRISRKSEDEPEMDEGSPNSSSSGKGAARLRIRGERRFRLTALRLWAEGVSSDEPDVNPGAAISASARWSRPLSGVVLSLASGGEFFSTDRSAPIYSLDLVPPDIFSSVRLAGKGARIWGEAQIAVPNIGTISLLWADFHPWSCGASRGRTLYLSFNQIWRNPE